jgi:hypothetical protein
LLFVGCATTIKIYDELPDNVPKGYVEFYNEDKKGASGFLWDVWKYQNGKFENITTYFLRPGIRLESWEGGQRRRIAERPGLHLFQLRIGSAVKEVEVEVIERMITPVRIIITNLGQYGGTYSFNMSLRVEKHTPYEGEERLRPEKDRLQAQPSQIDSIGGPKESDIARGLTRVSNKQYIEAISPLASGLKWLNSDPSYRATSDSLISKEAEYVSKLIEQIRSANQKGVFGSSNPMAIAIEAAIEAQAKVIESIDDRRRLQMGYVNEIRRDGRFIAYDNGTVLDTGSGLMWAAKDNGADLNWQGAKRYCENYRGGGHTDWRMPTIDELAGLINNAKTFKSSCRGYTPLTELIRSCTAIWASETRGSEAAYFHFFLGPGGIHMLNDGERGWSPQSSDGIFGKRALPVRSGK